MYIFAPQIGLLSVISAPFLVNSPFFSTIYVGLTRGFCSIRGMKKVRIILWVIFGGVLLSVGGNLWMVGATWGEIYDDSSLLPEHEVGLLLGTSKYLTDGGINLHFRNRILAAAKLYRAGKIKRIIASGDNYSDPNYNEPDAMKEALMAEGVPESAIELDPKGLRTLDSVVRANSVFGLDEFVIISQGYHNARAVFIARHNGLDAVAFNTEPVPTKHAIKTWIREYFARLKALADLYILDKQPLFPDDSSRAAN